MDTVTTDFASTRQKGSSSLPLLMQDHSGRDSVALGTGSLSPQPPGISVPARTSSGDNLALSRSTEESTARSDHQTHPLRLDGQTTRLIRSV